jgi:excisionase family DNA binding protein
MAANKSITKDRLNRVTNLKSLPEAAEELGVTVNCLRAWVYRRTIPYVKVGRCVRIAESTIGEIIARGTVPALEER